MKNTQKAGVTIYNTNILCAKLLIFFINDTTWRLCTYLYKSDKYSQKIFQAIISFPMFIVFNTLYENPLPNLKVNTVKGR